MAVPVVVEPLELVVVDEVCEDPSVVVSFVVPPVVWVSFVVLSVVLSVFDCSVALDDDEALFSSELLDVFDSVVLLETVLLEETDELDELVTFAPSLV